MKSMKTTDPYEQRITTVPQRMYWDQCSNSKVRGHTPPQYTKQELTEWVLSQPNYLALYNAWKESDYISNLRPSCDRLDNSKGYSLDNIELITWAENRSRAHRDIKAGTLGDRHRPTYQYTLDGTFVARYISQAEAERITGTNQQNISACCRGLLSYSNRFQWFYSEQDYVASIDANNDYNRTIYCYNLDGDLIDKYPSIQYVPEDGFSMEKVRSVITGEYATHNDHFFSFEYLEPRQIDIDTTYKPKEIQQLTKEGELVSTFVSMSAAEQATGIRSGNISKCCNGKAKSAGGFIWRRS